MARDENPSEGKREADDGSAAADGLRRLERATTRDEIADERDRAAGLRDREARGVAVQSVAGQPADSPLRRAAVACELQREAAAEDRRRAASDRGLASEDRLAAYASERQMRAQVMRSELDGRSGIFAGELGMQALRNEIDRCRRTGTVLADSRHSTEWASTPS